MWKNKFNYEDTSLAKGVLLAFVILFFHVGMLLTVALLVVFFGFIIKYFAWILLALGLGIGATIFYILYSLKKQTGGLADVLAMPEFRGKNIELKLFGGLASLKVTDSQKSESMLEYDGQAEPLYLESPDNSRVRELSELARLLENDMITSEEYQQIKSELFNREKGDSCQHPMKNQAGN